MKFTTSKMIQFFHCDPAGIVFCQYFYILSESKEDFLGVLPNEQSKLIGLSKFSRIADWVMSRPQIQEEAVMQLADELERRFDPDGLAIVLEADHFCMQWRGVKDESHMTNSIMRGAFLHNPELRREFLQLLKP